MLKVGKRYEVLQSDVAAVMGDPTSVTIIEEINGVYKGDNGLSYDGIGRHGMSEGREMMYEHFNLNMFREL